jgi:endonuclease/exonuclease/phosphatase (EEP) superfamily protein YafD
VRALAAAGVGVSVVAALGHLGGWWWRFDLIANVRPQLAVVLLVFATALAIGRRWRWTAVVGAVAVLEVATVAPLFVAPATPASPSGERIRVVTFNLYASNDHYDEVIEFLSSVSADVVFLHEASRPWEDALAAAGLPHQVVVTRSPDLIFGTLVLAPADAKVVGRGFSVGEPRAVSVDMTTDRGTDVALLGIHPLAPTSAGRAALRDAQLAYAAEWADGAGALSIVAGDFNASHWSSAFGDMLDPLVDSGRGFGIQPTFPTSLPSVLRIPIDHLLHGPGFRVVDRWLGPPLGSDHRPLVVDLAVSR